MHNGRSWFSYCSSISIASGSQQCPGVIIDLLAISPLFLPLSSPIARSTPAPSILWTFPWQPGERQRATEPAGLWLHAGSCLWSVHSPPLMNNVTAEAVLYQNATWRNITPSALSIDSTGMAPFLSILVTIMVTSPSVTPQTEKRSTHRKVLNRRTYVRIAYKRKASL